MYIYYNNNPKGKRIGDCVVRAISKALEIDYKTVGSMLLENSQKNNCHVITRDCYSKLLEKQFGLKRMKANNITVGELANLLQDHKLLIRIKNHLTCSIYGDVYDIWNPENEMVDVFWIVY